jgi:4-amino-4-deoxy-L-arabinose transferase-like glycosyltransferase
MVNGDTSSKKQRRITRILILIIFLLIPPAFLINLSELRYIDDESIRAIVALEMNISGDYITPTIGGDYYYKKPPVFNWLISLAYIVSGNYSELASRSVNLIFLFIYALTVFLVIKKRYGIRIGYLTAFLFLVSGRIIIYESLFGLIDITYSWLIFLNFILIWKYIKREQYLPLFLVSYAITAATFLLKGLPPIAFQAITLIIASLSVRKLRILLSREHLAGICLFFLTTGSYYYAYSVRNPGEITTLLTTLYHESADKSAVSFGITDIFTHIFTYGFQIFYSYVPGTLVIFFFLKKQPFKLIKNDPFLLYLSRVFLFNIIIYLVSPETFMRYVLMLMPIPTLLFVIHFLKHVEERSIHGRIFQSIFLLVTLILFLGLPAFGFIEATGFVELVWLKITVLMLAFALVLPAMLKLRDRRIELVVISCLLMRIAFNWFILPSRTNGHWEIRAKQEARRIAALTNDSPLYELTNDAGETRYTPVVLLCYMTAVKQEIIHDLNGLSRDGYYLVYDPVDRFADYKVDSLVARPDLTLSLLKINKNQNE